MSDATTSRADGSPRPDRATSVDALAGCLRELRAWSGLSYRELHRRLVRLRRSRGVAEEPAYATVYRCLQPGRARLDIELVADIVTVMTDASEAIRWRQAYARISGETATPSYAAVFDILPDDIGDFTGREAELAALTEASDTRIVAIEGMAGVGKTSLAVRAGRQLLQSNHVDVILSVNLAGYDPERAPAEPMAVLDGFLRTLGEAGPRIQALDTAERTARYRDLLARRRALVLLDNAASSDQVEPLLPGDTSTLVLVTSRHRVVQRPSARHVTLDVFPSDQAVDLLRKRIGDAVDEAPDTAAHIVEQVGLLPLAVAVVASRIEASPGWTLEDHREHLAERRESMRLDPGVELAFATSYETLPPSVKRMLRLLALHPGRDCDAYAAAALADIDLDLVRRQLTDLAEANLVGARTDDRFELHDLVRVFALNRAHEDDPPSARRTAVTRLLDYYRWATTVAMDQYAPEERHRRPDVPASAAAVPSVPNRAAAVAWLDTERPNLIALGAHAAGHGWPDHVSDLSMVLMRYLIVAAHYDDGARLHECASRVVVGARKGVALKNLATARWLQGHRSEALPLLLQALDTARIEEDRANESRVLTNLGNFYENLGRLREAEESRRQALAIYIALGDQVGESRARQNLGNTLRTRGKYDEAQGHLERSLDLSRNANGRVGEALALEGLARLFNLTGRYHDARDLAASAEAAGREAGERVARADALTAWGTACARLGDLRSAVAHQRHALALARETASQMTEIYARNELSSTLHQRGDLADALTHSGIALAIATRHDEPHSQAIAHDGMARIHLDEGAVELARRHWNAALEVFERLGTPEAANVRASLRRLDGDDDSPRSGVIGTKGE